MRKGDREKNQKYNLKKFRPSYLIQEDLIALAIVFISQKYC